MGLRIVEEGGKPFTTKITDADTGEDLTAKLRTSRIVINLDINAVATAVLTAYPAQIDVKVEEAQINRKCPFCGHETSETIRSAEDLKEKQ